MVLPLEPTEVPGVYRCGSRFVVVYRAAGRQHKQSAATLGEARAIKIARQADARERRRGPTLQGFCLAWLDRYAGSGHDVVREATRRGYRRLLVSFALTYLIERCASATSTGPRSSGSSTGSRRGRAAGGGCATARSRMR
jgi:hypothetical protein